MIQQRPRRIPCPSGASSKCHQIMMGFSLVGGSRRPWGQSPADLYTFGNKYQIQARSSAATLLCSILPGSLPHNAGRSGLLSFLPAPTLIYTDFSLPFARSLVSLHRPFTLAQRWRLLRLSLARLCFYTASYASGSSASRADSFPGIRSTSVMLNGMLRHAFPVLSSRYCARI